MTDSNAPVATPYQVFILLLSLAVLIALGVETAVPIDPEIRSVLLAFDFVAALVFLGDFLFTLRAAPDRGRYLRTWGWLDLLSSIPSVAILRWGRVARVARLLRLLRGARSLRALSRAVLRHRAESAGMAAALLALLAAVGGSILVLTFERAAGGNITTAGDALWWTVVTMSTAGYGDLYPVTGAGRVVAACLMVIGVGLFGACTGIVASWVVREPE